MRVCLYCCCYSLLAVEFLSGFGCVALLYVLFVTRHFGLILLLLLRMEKERRCKIFNEHHNYHINIVSLFNFLEGSENNRCLLKAMIVLLVPINRDRKGASTHHKSSLLFLTVQFFRHCYCPVVQIPALHNL